ncbi:hypothetical protein A6A04_17185 [Paramagnetospirillum marisnigri]|uniref:Water stress and hypersensitive response domain-containing protein n=2 Tax=Paramagnetospirillum marisnigri TaxID=1285242 RepID=A0A178MQS3_9PROT|nr:hypothetical protein A6A04_17185 [Paramagnetospirillum marisnigri]
MSIRRLTAAFLILLLAACTPSEFSEPPEVSLVDLRPLDVTLFEQRLAVGLRIRNPNDAAMSIDGMRFALEVNGRPFAKGMGDQTITVPRLSEAVTEGVAVVGTADLLRQLMGAPEAKGLDYHISGTLFLSGASRRSLPFDSQGSFDLFSSSVSKTRGAMP